MRVLLTGATGALGRPTLRGLIGAGHRVRAVVRRDAQAAWARGEGAEPLRVDLFDAEGLRSAVAGCDAVLHFATKIPPAGFRHGRRHFAETDRLRRDATRLLVDAALAAGARHFVQESISFVYADGGDRWLEEDAPLHPSWMNQSALASERETARFARESAGRGSGVALRYAGFYAPWAESTLRSVELARRRLLPIAGRGSQWFSSIHVGDAALAALAALDAPSGIYNVCDDDPVTFRDYACALAHAVGAGRPRRLPTPWVHLLVGAPAHVLLTSRRVSNERFRKATGWAPQKASVREGWPEVVRELSGASSAG